MARAGVRTRNVTRLVNTIEFNMAASWWCRAWEKDEIVSGCYRKMQKANDTEHRIITLIVLPALYKGFSGPHRLALSHHPFSYF